MQPKKTDRDSEGSAIADGVPSYSVSGGQQLPKIIPFDELNKCGDEIWISHNGSLYRLRSTKQGKLILTK